MKKLLTILTSFALTTPIIMSTISCNKKEKQEEDKKDNRQDISKFNHDLDFISDNKEKTIIDEFNKINNLNINLNEVDFIRINDKKAFIQIKDSSKNFKGRAALSFNLQISLKDIIGEN